MPLPDFSPIDDEEVLTLVLLDSTHPQIIAAATEIKNSLLISANQVLKAVENIKDFLVALEHEAAASQEAKSDAESIPSPPNTVKRGTVEDLLKRTKVIVDSSLKLTLELQSRSFLLLQVLLHPVRRRPQKLMDINKKQNLRRQAEAGAEVSTLPVLAGPSVSPLGSSMDSDASASTPLGPHTDDLRGDAGSAGRKHERDYSPDESQRRWKKKQPSNVDWMLKCRTKLLELKERTAKKAVSDVFMTERTVQETISFIDHNATKLEVVAAKNPSDFTAEE
ncbi:hypothetical protein Emag_003803 [Eimeria magna]